MLTTELGEQLRQGDVCSVPSFPRWTPESPRVDTVRPALLLVQAWDRPIKSDDGGHLAVVCSADCDVEHPRDRAGVLLAPVMALPAQPGSDREAAILASDVVSDGKIGYANLFPLVLPAEGGQQLAVADFSSMATLASAESAIAALTATRSYTMTSSTRVAFQKKLALFLYRPGED